MVGVLRNMKTERQSIPGTKIEPHGTRRVLGKMVYFKPVIDIVRSMITGVET